MDARTPENSFPVTLVNKVRRMHERAAYDHDSVYAILDSAFLCHVSYVIDGQPYCTPTIHWREGDWLYWHGSSASRMLKHLKGGTPVCLTVTHLDGLVLARSGFNHSANYRSVMCFGTARIVDVPEDKQKALKGVIERFYPGRSAELRANTAQEEKATMVIGMRIEQASAKCRAKQAGDDTEDFDIPAWAGVIPVTTVIGPAQTSPDVPHGVDVPAHLAPYRQGRRLDEALTECQRAYEADG